MNLEYNYSDKLINLTISQQNAQFKNMNSFLQKNSPIKFTSRRNIQPNTLTRWKYKGISVVNILAVSETI